MPTPFQEQQYVESTRDFVSSPVPGLDIRFHEGDDQRAEELGYFLRPNRYDDLNRATEVISGLPVDEGLPPPSFRADTVAVLASMLGSSIGKIEMSDEDIAEADRIIFRGGKSQWLGLDIETRPLFHDFVTDTQPTGEIKSTDIGKYIHDTMQDVDAPALLGRSEVQNFKGDETAEGQRHSISGRLLERLLKHEPDGKLKSADLSLLLEHYETTGQILLGTGDQFVDKGNAEQGLMAFLLLQLHESEQKPISQATNPGGSTLVKYYEDGSRKTEIYENQNHTVKLMFEAPDNVVEYGDRRAEDPLMTVVAGYEKMRKIPYLPDWMKESELIDQPTSAILEVYPDRYAIIIKN